MSKNYFDKVSGKAERAGMQLEVDRDAKKLKYSLHRGNQVLHREHTLSGVDGWLDAWLTYVR